MKTKLLPDFGGGHRLTAAAAQPPALGITDLSPWGPHGGHGPASYLLPSRLFPKETPEFS